MGNYIQQPIDIGVSGVNLRLPTSRILAELFSRADSENNHPFSTIPVAISQRCCIDNQNIHNTNKHMCLSCVRDDMLNF